MRKQVGGSFARRSNTMNAAISPSVMTLAVAITLSGLAPALAESMADAANGRYTLQPSGDGVIRLDTRTGTVSSCSNSGAGWACYAVPDERKALDQEIGRLQAENARLKAQVAAASSGKGEDKQGPDSQRKIEIPLPSDQDMDRVVSFLQRAWKRLVDMASQMQKDVSGDGKI